MNIEQFAALKVGDKIENLMNANATTGEVVETTGSGVRVVWGPRHDHETRFHYGMQTTAWMHWSRVDVEATGTRPDGIA